MNRTLLVAGITLTVLSCSSGPRADRDEVTAAATMEARSGSSVAGRVEFSEARNERVYVRVDVAGVAPNSTHGIHVHEKGDCTAADASSAGGHFNPNTGKHSALNDPMRHAGDLGNVRADDKGEIHEHFLAEALTLQGERGIVGKAIVLHADPDDLQSQPAGNSGKRIGCGVIAMADSVR